MDSYSTVLKTKGKIRKDQGVAVFNNTRKDALLTHYCGKCFYCKIELTVETTTFDHKTPKSRGGSDYYTNLAACCQECNSNKADMTEEEYRRFLHQRHQMIIATPMQLRQCVSKNPKDLSKRHILFE